MKFLHVDTQTWNFKPFTCDISCYFFNLYVSKKIYYV